MQLSIFFAALVAIIIPACVANVYYHSNLNNELVTFKGAPIYYGEQPFLSYGNVSGIITVANASNAQGNIVLCETFMPPIEDALLWCIQNNPAGVISVPPTGPNRLEYLGRTMYSIGKPRYAPELVHLSRIPIIEINQEDYKILATEMVTSVGGFTITLDGSTVNPWLEIKEGEWMISYQVLSAIFAGFVAIVACLVLRNWWYSGNELGWNVKTQVTVWIAIVSIFRGLYCSIDPTGTRRLIPAADDLIFTTINLIGVVAPTNICSLYWLETIINKDLKVYAFIKNPILKGVNIVMIGVWFILLIIWRVLAAFPSVSPLATGNSIFALILIQVILLGLNAAIYTVIAIISFVKIYQTLKKTRSRESTTRKIYRAAYLILTCVALWFLFAVTVTALTPLWNIPIISTTLQPLCYFPDHPTIHIFQVLSFTTRSSSNPSTSSKTTYSTSNIKSNRSMSVGVATTQNDQELSVTQSDTDSVSV